MVLLYQPKSIFKPNFALCGTIVIYNHKDSGLYYNCVTIVNYASSSAVVFAFAIIKARCKLKRKLCIQMHNYDCKVFVVRATEPLGHIIQSKVPQITKTYLTCQDDSLVNGPQAQKDPILKTFFQYVKKLIVEYFPPINACGCITLSVNYHDDTPR